MANKTIGLSDALQEYVVRVGAREPGVLRALREETAALPQHAMQIAPEQGAFLRLLVELMGARRCIEVGTFTGYSSTAIALGLPEGGELVCCDVSTEWTDVARRYWSRAGVDDKVELRIGPGVETLDELAAAEGGPASYDFAFVDADKPGYPDYYERLLRLLRPGGLLVFDNMLRGGDVIDPSADDEGTVAIRDLNDRLATDERISLSLLPLADGVTLVRKR